VLAAPATILRCPTCPRVFKLVRGTPPVMPAGMATPDGTYAGACECGTFVTIAFSTKATVERHLAQLGKRV
jgi:hypothetical protein